MDHGRRHGGTDRRDRGGRRLREKPPGDRVPRYGPAYYQGGLFWIDAAAADDELKQEQAFQEFFAPSAFRQLKALHERGKKARDEVTRALQQLPNAEPVLFVIDNVPESGRKRSRNRFDLVPRARPRNGARTSRMHVRLEGRKHPGIEHRCARP